MQGRGKIYVGSDFCGANGSAAVLDSDVQAFGVGTEVYAAKVDESGGVFRFTTGSTDNDNAVIRTGPFVPRDGKIVVTARFKYQNLGCAVFVGLADTLDTTTPVMPAEFSTVTMTYSGALVGFSYDSNGTTDDFRAVMGSGSAAISDSANGTRANATLTVDNWFEAQVIVNEDGSAECWFGDSGHILSDGTLKLRLIKRFSTGTLLTTTALLFPVLMVEARSAAARILDIDYFFVSAGRDWRP